jgi:hypothetical protein
MKHLFQKCTIHNKSVISIILLNENSNTLIVTIAMEKKILFEKLTVVQQVKKFPARCGNRRFVNRIHNNPKLGPILSKINLIYALTSLDPF